VAAKIEEQKAEALEKMKAEGVTEPRNLEEQGLCLVGKDIFEKLIKEYTEKQWGRPSRDLPAFIIKRLPVRLVFDNNYFNDSYQGIPIGGYNKLIEGLLNGIETKTDTDFFNSVYKDWRSYAKQLVYTGPIDEYFGFCYGKLDWRTVIFKTKVLDTPNYQGNAVVNYTSHEQPYTRIIEHKHFEMFGQAIYDTPKTVISEEYSMEFRDGMEPFYAVNDERNDKLAAKYRQMAENEECVLFGGRLAEYKYYDMAPIVEKVINLWK
jgi:UDP-galactopyranose mutase